MFKLPIPPPMKRYLLPLLCLLAAADLHANGGGYSKGVNSTSAFQPIGVDQVEMLSERLEIDLHIEHADIRIEYVLHNPGKKVTVECGFPAATSNYNMFVPQEQLAARKPEMLEDLSLTADNDPLKVSILEDNARLNGGVRREKPLSIVSWHVVKIPFAAGQTRKISVRYRNPYYRQESTVSEDSTSSAPSLTYAFSAAGLWSGPIKQGTVMIHAKTVDPERVKLSHPKRFTREKGSWQWSFTDFEPTLEDDLIIETRPARHGFQGAYLAEGGEWSESGLRGAKWAFFAEYTATASSFLKEPDGTEHPPENLNYWRQAWVEGAEGDGIGESITLTLKKPANVTQVGLFNGYTKSRELYFANNRAAQFKVSVNGGEAFKIDVPDEFLETERFWFELPKSAAPVKTIKFEISDVYPGTKYKDTAISDIDLLVPLDKAPKIQPAR
jgi:hypothetical protein